MFDNTSWFVIFLREWKKIRKSTFQASLEHNSFVRKARDNECRKKFGIFFPQNKNPIYTLMYIALYLFYVYFALFCIFSFLNLIIFSLQQYYGISIFIENQKKD